MKKAAFLDRDGVINQRAPAGQYITALEEMHILSGAAEAIGLLNRAGYLAIVVTNQRCVAKGLITALQLEDLHKKMCDDLARRGGAIDAIYYCPHELTPPCDCRKPQPGMLLQAAREHNIDLAASWMVGDSARDIGAGRNAGCRTIRLLDGNEEDDRDADLFATSLLEAVHKIVGLDQSTSGQASGSRIPFRSPDDPIIR